ncbi:MAG: RNA polymerase sigma factor [Clostridia bacterium]|nr:RNA polymerase sigma factor [Clostridia bacterium]
MSFSDRRKKTNCVEEFSAVADKNKLLETAYDKYADMLYRVALSQLQSADDAQDAVQDVFVKYINTAPSFNDAEHERAWLIRVTVNTCHDAMRKRKRRSYVSLDDVAEISEQDSGFDAVGAVGVMRALAELPEKHRTVIVLHHLEGFSVEKVAQMLGLSVSATKMRLSRGRDALKKIMGKED